MDFAAAGGGLGLDGLDERELAEDVAEPAGRRRGHALRVEGRLLVAREARRAARLLQEAAPRALAVLGRRALAGGHGRRPRDPHLPGHSAHGGLRGARRGRQGRGGRRRAPRRPP